MVDIVTESKNYNIDSLANNGSGISFDEGRKIFIPHSLPGEVVRAHITHKSSKYIKASLDLVVKTSPHRIKAACKHFGECGGCSLQHLNEASYLEFKRNLFRHCLSRSGFEDRGFPLKSVGPYQRRRTRVKCKIINKKVIIGYHKACSNNLVNISECFVLSEKILATIQILKLCFLGFSSRFNHQDFEINLTECSNGIDVMIDCALAPEMQELESLSKSLQHPDIIRINWKNKVEISPIAMKTQPIIMVCGREIAIPDDNFLQASELAQNWIIEFINNSISESAYVADLYAGCGIYSCSINAQKIDGFEGSQAMVATAKKQFSHINFIERDLFYNPVTPDELTKYQHIIINPPRNGAGPQINAIAASKLHHVVMVSCNPDSFARDAQILQKSGFKLENAIAIDQFYWSHHLEILAYFIKSS